MSQKAITIEHLYTHILEEIFLYLPDRKTLRLVSKTFKDIIDESPRLMEKYALNVSEISKCTSNVTNSFYQNIKFNNLTIEEFKWIHNYQHKNRIKSIRIEADEGVIERSAVFLQYILLNADNLRKIEIEISGDTVNAGQIINPNVSNLTVSEHSRLESLDICCNDNIGHILNMFSTVQSIKSLEISHCFSYDLPDDVAWRLEKLVLTCSEPNDDSLIWFLENQKRTLRRFDYVFSHNFSSFVVRNLPNLDNLFLDIGNDEGFDDEFLVSNDRLRSLSLYGLTENKRVMEMLLKHYKSIKCLSLHSYYECPKLTGLKSMKLPNITHLLLNRSVKNFLVCMKMPNLKILEIVNEEHGVAYNFRNFPKENLKNIEKLSIQEVRSVEDIYMIIQKCPKLRHLNIGYIGSYKKIPSTEMINDILAHAPKLRCLGLLQGYLNKHEKHPSEVCRERKKLKVYKDFSSMVVEYWDPRDVGNLYFISD